MKLYGTTVLKNSFNITLQQEQRTLPQIYWTPKLHKTPYKARFIAAPAHVLPISSLINSRECLKLVKRHRTVQC